MSLIDFQYFKPSLMRWELKLITDVIFVLWYNEMCQHLETVGLLYFPSNQWVKFSKPFMGRRSKT